MKTKRCLLIQTHKKEQETQLMQVTLEPKKKKTKVLNKELPTKKGKKGLKKKKEATKKYKVKLIEEELRERVELYIQENLSYNKGGLISNEEILEAFCKKNGYVHSHLRSLLVHITNLVKKLFDIQDVTSSKLPVVPIISFDEN